MLEMNGVAIQSVTFNGVEVQTWVHNGVEVYSGVEAIIKDGVWNQKYQFTPFGNSIYDIEIIQEDGYVKFYHYLDHESAYLMTEETIDFTKYSKVKFKVKSASGANYANTYRIGLCTGNNGSHPVNVRSTSIASPDEAEYEIDVSSINQSCYIYIGVPSNYTTTLELYDLYFE